jgi:hypothetical protein
MRISEVFSAELRSLQNELQEMMQAQAALPPGAHISGLFELAMARIEQRMTVLYRVHSSTLSAFQRASMRLPERAWNVSYSKFA